MVISVMAVAVAVLLAVSTARPRGFFPPRRLVLVYALLIAFFALEKIYLTYTQFSLWQDNNLSRYFLPPYRSIGYFIQYAFFRFWAHFLAALVFSLALLWITSYFNRRHRQRYFWPEEPYFIALAVLVVGYPGLLVYFSLILLAPFLISSLQFLISKKAERISYYYLWLSLALAALVLNRWLETFWWWGKLII